ncbi:MAG: hypothetical protein ACRELB_05280 [Polyangiaceae bacterium]
MMRTLKHGATVGAVFGVLGILGAGCLSRPVTSSPPNTNTNFTAVVHNQTVDKVDLLFMIDNSASMGDKQALLAEAVPIMINRLVAPNCLDATGAPDGTTADQDGNCANGDKAEFPPVHDMHIGVVSSSLGGRGGDQCSATATNPANGALNAHNDDRGELINRGGVQTDPTVENTAPDVNASNFLSWFPNVTANASHPQPLPPAVGAQTQLVTDFTAMVAGVHEHGCGFEAQNEAWYRFLVQPDPFDQITKNGTVASLSGFDKTILQQRHDFLRPDSLLAIIVVTDENEEAADPLSIGGQGWAFDNGSFPGSPNGAAPQGTVECQNLDPNNPATTGPNDPNCTSCAFIQGEGDFATRCPPDGANGSKGYLDPTDDTLNTRFYHQKQRFGLFAGYPTSRYVRGMQKITVPDSGHEHDSNGNYIGDQEAQANCVNPIYATNLPTDPAGELCALDAGPRTPDLVYYAAIAGVPHQLLQQDPTNPDSPQKDTLTDADWKLIMGNDPENYDFSGADFHMIEDWNPRTTQGVYANASACPPTAASNCDPINGREWTTNKGDLQFSCIFDLRPQYGGVGKDCTDSKFSGACDCAANALNSGTQLCDATTKTLQVNGKAYPSVREMIIAKAMSDSSAGNQGIVSSLCPIHVTAANGDKTGDPLYGYNPAVNAIINRLKNSLSNQCLPQKLVPDQNQYVPCLILVQLSAQVGPGACKNPGGACNSAQGLLGPGVTPAGATAPTLSQDILDKYCDAQESGFKGKKGDPGDPDTYPVCALSQLTPVNNASDFTNGGCGASKDPGWCYVEGAAANGCPQAILFSNGEPPTGSTVSLQCIEQAVTVVGGTDAGAGGGG